LFGFFPLFLLVDDVIAPMVPAELAAIRICFIIIFVCQFGVPPAFSVFLSNQDVPVPNEPDLRYKTCGPNCGCFLIDRFFVTPYGFVLENGLKLL